MVSNGKERNPTVRKILSDVTGVSEDTYSKGKKILDSNNETLKQEVLFLSGEKVSMLAIKNLRKIKHDNTVDSISVLMG